MAGNEWPADQQLVCLLFIYMVVHEKYVYAAFVCMTAGKLFPIDRDPAY